LPAVQGDVLHADASGPRQDTALRLWRGRPPRYHCRLCLEPRRCRCRRQLPAVRRPQVAHQHWLCRLPLRLHVLRPAPGPRPGPVRLEHLTASLRRHGGHSLAPLSRRRRPARRTDVHRRCSRPCRRGGGHSARRDPLNPFRLSLTPLLPGRARAGTCSRARPVRNSLDPSRPMRGGSDNLALLPAGPGPCTAGWWMLGRRPIAVAGALPGTHGSRPTRPVTVAPPLKPARAAAAEAAAGPKSGCQWARAGQPH
jgi:hypothetical protein